MPVTGRNAGLRLPGSGYGDGCGCIPQRDYFADLGAQYMQCGVCGQCRFGRQRFVPAVFGEGELGVVAGRDSWSGFVCMYFYALLFCLFSRIFRSIPGNCRPICAKCLP